jgi:hypothetical protein
MMAVNGSRAAQEEDKYILYEYNDADEEDDLDNNEDGSDPEDDNKDELGPECWNVQVGEKYVAVM